VVRLQKSQEKTDGPSFRVKSLRPDSRSQIVLWHQGDKTAVSLMEDCRSQQQERKSDPLDFADRA
jgi:hypothetical protein